MSNQLVVFYSWGGNTKAAAEYISQKTEADLLALHVENEYPSEYYACVNKVGRDGRNYEPVLASEIPNLSQYDVVFVGAPCWWGTIANPLRTFLHRAALDGKTIIPFMTHGTSGLCVQDVKKLCPKSNVRKGLGIYNQYQVTTTENHVSNMGDYKTKIDNWLNELDI